MDQQHQKALNDVLKGLLGSNNVYFQPPENRSLLYPCIVYEQTQPSVRHANNVPYNMQAQYQVTLIDRDPNSSTFKKLVNLPLCTNRTNFTTENLNHWVFDLYF